MRRRRPLVGGMCMPPGAPHHGVVLSRPSRHAPHPAAREWGGIWVPSLNPWAVPLSCISRCAALGLASILYTLFLFFPLTRMESQTAESKWAAETHVSPHGVHHARPAWPQLALPAPRRRLLLEKMQTSTPRFVGMGVRGPRSMGARREMAGEAAWRGARRGSAWIAGLPPPRNCPPPRSCPSPGWPRGGAVRGLTQPAISPEEKMSASSRPDRFLES